MKKFLTILAAAALILPSMAEAQIATRTGTRFTAHVSEDPSQPCPRSAFRVAAKGGESIPALLGGLVTTFVDKGLGVFVNWLEKRKERLSGTATGRVTDAFYDGEAVKATCYVFSSGEFGEGGPVREDVYVELYPQTLDGGATFTLRPVFLQYNSTVAQAKSKGGKNVTLAVTYKFASVGGEGEKAKSELVDGGGFLLDFGKLREGTRLDHGALAGVDGGLTFTPPHTAAGQPGEGSYEMTALWAETAEPSPIYNAFVASVKANQEDASATLAAAIRKALGLPDPE